MNPLYLATTLTSSNEFQAYYDICGNSSLQEAEIVFVTNSNDGIAKSEKNAELINYIWCNHLLLIEIKPFGKSAQSWEYDFTQGIESHIEMEGWDHPSFESRIFGLKERENNINNLANRVRENIREGCWGLFLKENESFVSLLKKGSKQIQKKKHEIRQLLNQGLHENFIMQVNHVIEQVKIKHQVAVNDVYAKSWQLRFDCLTKAIDKGLKQHSKVIVLLSSYMIICNPRLQAKEFNSQKFEDYLKDKKFVIIHTKGSNMFISNQPELWPQKRLSPSFLQLENFGERILEEFRSLNLRDHNLPDRRALSPQPPKVITIFAPQPKRMLNHLVQNSSDSCVLEIIDSEEESAKPNSHS